MPLLFWSATVFPCFYWRMKMTTSGPFHYSAKCEHSATSRGHNKVSRARPKPNGETAIENSVWLDSHPASGFPSWLNTRDPGST